MATWDVQVRSYAGNGGAYVELRIGGDRCATFASPRQVREFIQQLPAIGAQLKAASKDAFESAQGVGAASETQAGGPSPLAD
jgi:hypothetical protein